MIKKFCTFAVLVMLISLFAGCAQKKDRTPLSESKMITITDLKGRQVKIKNPPERVVLLEYGGTAAEIIKALKLEKSIIAIDEGTKRDLKWPTYILSLPSVGETSNPNLEQIISLKPDLVIAWDLKPEVLAKLQENGIPAILGYTMGASKVPETITSFGQIFNQEERAKEFLCYIDNQFHAVSERTKGLSPEQKPKVYVEGSSPWMGFKDTEDRLEPRMVEIAGGNYLLKGKMVEAHKLSPEWVVKENPDIIIKLVRGSKLVGFDVTDPAGLKAVRDEICSRPALKETKAVKNRRVYVMEETLLRSRAAAGIWYLAKWFHPDLFKDVDPEAKHSEILNKFFETKLRGTWVYPEK